MTDITQKAAIWSLPQKAAGTLQAPTRCACCQKGMAQGQAFAWVEVRVATGSKVGAGTRSRFAPGHLNTLCGMVDLRLWQAQHELTSAQQTLALLQAAEPAIPERALNIIQQMIDKLTAEIAELPGYIV